MAQKPAAPPEVRASKRRAAAGDARAGAATGADEREVSSRARPKEIRARARSRDFAEEDEEKIERVMIRHSNAAPREPSLRRAV